MMPTLKEIIVYWSIIDAEHIQSLYPKTNIIKVCSKTWAKYSLQEWKEMKEKWLCKDWYYILGK